MKIGIVGAGHIGETLAGHFAGADHEVQISNSKGPESLAGTVAKIGQGVRAATTADAVQFGEVVLLAVPWTARDAAIRSAGPFTGKVVIDAMNPYTEYPKVEDLGETTSSEVVSEALPGAWVVKAFNTIYFESLRDRGKPGAPTQGRVALPIAGDEAAAKAIVARLIDEIGFAPVDIGPLRRGRHAEPYKELYSRDFFEPQFREQVARLPED